MTFTLIPLILFFFHLTLYSFYKKQRQNLFYAFCLLGFAGLTFFKYERLVLIDPATTIFYFMMSNVSAIVAIFFGMMTAFATAFTKIPKYWMLFLVLGLAIIVSGIFQPISIYVGVFIYIYFAISMLAAFFLGFRSKQKNQKGIWIILTGFILLNIFIAYQILIDYSFVVPLFNIDQVFVYGMLGLAISMSVFLAYNFAYVNKDLELQLNNVKIYSEKVLEQEKKAIAAELERRIIQVESERKTKELEEATELQLSLLPKVVPKLENLDIACFMKTATEVGGDYYDFFLTVMIIFLPQLPAMQPGTD